MVSMQKHLKICFLVKSDGNFIVWQTPPLCNKNVNFTCYAVNFVSKETKLICFFCQILKKCYKIWVAYCVSLHFVFNPCHVTLKSCFTLPTVVIIDNKNNFHSRIALSTLLNMGKYYINKGIWSRFRHNICTRTTAELYLVLTFEHFQQPC